MFLFLGDSICSSSKGLLLMDGSRLSWVQVGNVFLGAASGLYAVLHAEVLVGGGTLVIVCSIAVADPMLKELSKGVEWRTCWLWEKSGGY